MRGLKDLRADNLFGPGVNAHITPKGALHLHPPTYTRRLQREDERDYLKQAGQAPEPQP